CIFGRTITPNHHALAETFVLLDNFFVDAEVSADGHEWSTGAIATDFVEKTWPTSYSGRGLPYPSEGSFSIAFPTNGYIWEAVAAAGLTYRSYGEFIEISGDSLIARHPALVEHFAPHFRSWDLDYPDTLRAAAFIEELSRFEAQGEMPQFIILRLPNDHTIGTMPGKLSPRAMIADNDLALGRVVEAVTRSRFWPTTAIFVLEDDAQNGPDHVDAHRSPALLISPYVRRGEVDHTLYDTVSMLATMEMILGLKPLSQYDAAAFPMVTCFTDTPDFTPYTALRPEVSMAERNSAASWGSRESMLMNFDREDATPELELNEIVWRSIKGEDSVMPRPVHRRSLGAEQETDEE
ncbi:MAG TPA: alkaline phosphatase family protein, partial [bacterium]|nr:alkaline phosphatase family protein [bacterium]